MQNTFQSQLYQTQQQLKNCCCCKNSPTLVGSSTVQNTLIAERENLRIQYSELQNEYYRDIEQVKKQVIQECELTLEEELRQQEVTFQNQINGLNAEISSLQSQVNEKTKKHQALQDDYQVVAHKCAEQHEKIKRQKAKKRVLKQEIIDLKKRHQSEHSKIIVEKEVEIKNYLTLQFQNERNALILENEALRKKIADFEIQISRIGDLLKDIESFKIVVNKKNEELNTWKLKFADMEQYFEKEIDLLRSKIQNQTELEQTIVNLKQKLKLAKEKADHSSHHTKTEYITVEKPTVVEKLVEVIKHVPQETVIRERIAPKQPIVVQEIVQGEDEELQDKLQRKSEKIKMLKQTIEEQQAEFDILEEQIEFLNSNQANKQNDNAQLLAQITKQHRHIKELERLLLESQRDVATTSQHTVESKNNRIIVKNQNNEKLYEKVH